MNQNVNRLNAKLSTKDNNRLEPQARPAAQYLRQVQQEQEGQQGNRGAVDKSLSPVGGWSKVSSIIGVEGY